MRSPSGSSLVWLLVFLLLMVHSSQAFVLPTHQKTTASLSLSALSKRELEIRRKIKELKQDGRLRSDDSIEYDDEEYDYSDKIRQKLGTKKSKLLGLDSGGGGRLSKVEEQEKDDTPPNARLGRLETSSSSSSGTITEGYRPPTAAGDTTVGTLASDNDDDDDLPEDDLVDLVAQRMQEKRDREKRERDQRLREAAQERQQQLSQKKITTGVGGRWEDDDTAKAELYQPKSGSWGAFPRPRDISKAYGGGRRVGVGYSSEQKEASISDTRNRLQRYREKVGIDVASEKEHAEEIEQALGIAGVAMQRGIYSTAVSALEKISKYCSSNSKVGGKVFLELAMAYEAVGRTDEAITVYTTLSRSRIEEIKINAKRLLYGIEAMQFMQENVSGFSRRKAKATFIDTTGLGDIASKFDDVYETAYIDMDRGFYKKLTESVVRSAREARQIVLRATGPGEVGRLRIVQALRCLSRGFADALQVEIDSSKQPAEPTAVIDGKPITRKQSNELANLVSMEEEFTLMDSVQMLENLNGEWRLQLIADKRGDGVKFFNNTLAWQRLDTNDLTFCSVSPQGFLNVEQSGRLVFNERRRILRRRGVESSGGVLSGLFGKTSGAVGAIRVERQVVLVDSSLLVTRGVPALRRRNSSEDEKDYFAVWRRVKPGTFSEQKP